MKIYISGKITGLPFREVKDKFQAVQNFLEELGFEVINPLKNGLKNEASWEKNMLRDIELIFTCDIVYMMKGWINSIGSCIEFDIAKRMGKNILFESDMVIELNSVTKIKDAIHEVTGMKFNEYITKRRKRNGFYARMLFVHKCSENGMKITTISKLIQRDRTTVLYVLNKYDDEVKYNPEFRRLAEKFNEIMR
jgi:hypothetical protein